MFPQWRIFLLIVLVFSIVSNVGVGAEPRGKVIVSSDLELLSLGDVNDGGHVTWTLTGEQAILLRQKVLWMFDQGASIPRGFLFPNQPTGSTGANLNNGLIDSPEGTVFLTLLDSSMETGPAGVGTPFRFVTITHVDRLERDLPAERSSEGLVGANAATSTNLEIRFIFNGNSPSPARTFPEADENLAQALHRLFSFDTGEENLNATGCPPACYPILPRNGFLLVNPPPTNYSLTPSRFLWAGGNVSAVPWNATRAYRANDSYSTFYSDDPSGVGETPLDLRYATSANFSFQHTGWTSPDDNLTVRVSPDRTNWTTLIATNDGDGKAPIDGLTLGQPIGTSVFDLTSYSAGSPSGLGQRLYLRLDFTANGDAIVEGPGYFIRNMRVQAPSRYVGLIDFRHTDYVVGFLSFSDFASTAVRPHLIRTPVGEIQFYNAVYETGAAPNDVARYATFNVIENPQVLFILLIIAAWLIGFFQDRGYNTYRRQHAASVRAATTKIRWLHWVGRTVIILLVVFYFFPTALTGIGLVFGGPAFWILAIGSCAGVSGFSTFWYWRRAKLLPPEPTIGPGETLSSDVVPPPPTTAGSAPRLICAHCDRDIEDAATAFVCECGEAYHPEHAAARKKCVRCGRPLFAEKPPEKQMMTVKCPTCGEVNVVESAVDLAFTRCTACSVILEEIAPKYNYLVIADEPNAAYEWFNSVVRKGAPGICLSTTFPEKLRREYGLPDIELYWLSDTNPGPRTLDPKRLDFEIMRAVSNFVKNNKGGAIVLDGLEYLIVENSFDRVLKFIKKVNDLASVHDATMFVPITPTGLGPEEATLLRKEFDKVESIPPGAITKSPPKPAPPPKPPPTDESVREHDSPPRETGPDEPPPPP